MDRRNFIFSAFVAAQTAWGQTKDSSLITRVSYTGSGTVSQSHKLYVVLWDTPDFTKDDSKLQPLDVQPVTSKSASVRFNKIKKNPVYVSLVYDPAGAYDGKTKPPAGSSVGLYSQEQGIPTPISLKPGQSTTIAARLDDSTKMK